MMKSGRKYDKEFKLNAAKLYENSDQSSEKIAKELGIPKSTLQAWIQQYKEYREEGFPGSGKMRPEDEKLYRLQRELADVKLERDILKKAVAIFSRAK